MLGLVGENGIEWVKIKGDNGVKREDMKQKLNKNKTSMMRFWKKMGMR